MDTQSTRPAFFRSCERPHPYVLHEELEQNPKNFYPKWRFSKKKRHVKFSAHRSIPDVSRFDKPCNNSSNLWKSRKYKFHYLTSKPFIYTARKLSWVHQDWNMAASSSTDTPSGEEVLTKRYTMSWKISNSVFRRSISSRSIERAPSLPGRVQDQARRERKFLVLDQQP